MTVIGGAVANHLRVMLEIGPKGKKAVAVALDWPGLARGAKTEQAAIDRLLSYLPRYAPVAKLAGMQAAFATITAADVAEHYTGVGGTDFWGISFAFSSIDHQVMSGEALEYELTLMRACWTFFDAVRARVSAEMQRGPRGGGRDRDKMIGHVIEADHAYAREIGVRLPEPHIGEREAIEAERAAMLEVLRRPSDGGPLAERRWTQRYAARRIAWHALDHAWEMEDRSDS